MTSLVYVIAYLGIAFFLIAVAARFVFWSRMPMHLRWELYPVAHDAGAAHGGSHYEVSEHWTQKAKPNRLNEMNYLKAKVDAGADYICTQLFFDNRDFYDFCERCQLAGIELPIVAGIMPITTRSGMKRMAELALGARFPASLERAVARCRDDKAVERVGNHWATEQCRDLLDHGVRGIHLYTLNRSGSTLEIYRSLGISDS